MLKKARPKEKDILKSALAPPLLQIILRCSGGLVWWAILLHKMDDREEKKRKEAMLLPAHSKRADGIAKKGKTRGKMV
jgi:hypothetical protein